MTTKSRKPKAAEIEAEKPEVIVEAVAEELAEAKEIIAEQQEVIKSLSQEKTTGDPVVTIKGQKYKVTIKRFLFQGQDFTAENIKKDAALAERLLEIGFAGLQKI
jgi:hypothetical protein